MANVIDIVFYIGFCIAGGLTSLHLWSRVPKLEGKLKKLFFFTGFTFMVIIFISLYYIINILLDLQGQTTLDDLINASIQDVRFDLFNLGFYTVSIPGDSILVFGLLMLGLSVYLYPIEKYAKQKTPWHTITVLICLAIIPLMVIIDVNPDMNFLLSIVTIIVVGWVLYNFFFLFYLYFSTGLQSPKGSEMRKASFMIGIGIVFLISIWIVNWALSIGIENLVFIVQTILGSLGILLFNYGFYLIRPT
jgi:hypothetical protein